MNILLFGWNILSKIRSLWGLITEGIGTPDQREGLTSPEGILVRRKKEKSACPL